MPHEVKPIKYQILDHIEVPEAVIRNWQITVDLLAKIANIPAALIMRVHEQEIEVFVSSHSEGNVYHQGEKAPLDFGHYCETVMNTQRELIVPNALKDPLWDKNPDIKLGMISYCGLPLTWPGGEIFGTICILDNQEHVYSPEIRDVLERFRDSVQFSLETIYNSSVERNQAKEVAKEQYSTLRSALDSTDAHIFSLDRQYRYTSFNKGHVAVMKAIYGAEIEIGRSLFDYQTVPEDREKAKRNIDRALAGERFVESSYSGEEKLTRLFFEVSHNPVVAEDGSIIGVVAFSQDITRRKQTEDELHRNIILSEQSRKTMLSILEDQKRSEDAIRKSEEKYRTLLQTAMDGFWLADGKGKLLQVNDAYCRMSGYTEQELLTMRIKDLDSAETAAANEAHIKAIIAKGEDRFETKHRKKNASLFDVEVNVQFKDIEEGRFIVFLQDITERKRTEKALAASRKMLNDILDNTRIHLWAFDGTHYLYTNKEWFNFTGQDPNFSLTIERWVSAVHPNDQAPSGEIWMKNFEAKTEHDNYFRILRYDGVYRDFYCHAVPIYDHEGKFQYFQGFNFDITERKQAEVALRRSEAIKNKMVSNIGDVIVITDQNGINQYNSPNITKLFGWKPEELVGKSTWDIVHADDLEATKKFIGYLSAKPNAAGTTEIRYKRKDGNYVWIEISVMNLLSDPDIKGFLGNYHDISDRKQTEFELIKAKDKAEESDRLKTAFLCNMSHEIRTPMNGILGFSALLSEPGLESEEQQEYIKIIQKSGTRMLNIISEIMDISKIESGLTEIRFKEVNIAKHVESVYELLKPDAEVKKINLFIKNSLPMDEPIFKTDGEKLFAILSNLVKNAIKYTDKGTIEFGYGPACLSDKFNELQFYVKDTGIGIPKDRQQAIFERFIQADIADVQARQGAGLGLSIAKAYVEMLGGEIWVESEQGIGSCFYFTIPINAEPDEKNVAAKVFLKESLENNIHPEVLALKILIAEDDEVSKTLFYKNLTPFSKQIMVTTTGVETIEACRINPDIDLILMDIRMPNLNGYEATRQIRQFNKEVVIIAQTSFGLSGDREKAIESGCNDYIAKPINKDELLVLIQKYFVDKSV